MSKKSETKKQYWAKLFKDIPEDELPEDIVCVDGKYTQAVYNLSPEKIKIALMIESNIKAREMSDSLRSIKGYVGIAFWGSIIIGIISLIIALLNT